MASRAQSITITYVAWDTSANAGKTGDVANHTLRWVKDGTSAAPTNTPTEVDATNAPGLYKLVLTASECTCDCGVLAGKSSTANVVVMPLTVTFEQLPTSAPGANNGLPIQGGAIPNANAGANGGLATVDASNAVKVQSGTGANQLDLSSGQVKVQVGTGAGQLDTVSGQVKVTQVNDKTGYSLATNDSPLVDSGTAQAGAAGTITLRSGASATDNLYRGQLVYLTSGTGAGQARVIAGYVGSTKVATVDENWQTAPDATTTYVVLRQRNPKLNSSLEVVAASVTAAVDILQTAADKVWGSAARTLTAFGFSVTVGASSIQAIWDAATTALTTAGSIGKRLVDNITGDAFARLGAPAGASLAADVAAVKAQTAAIETDTQDIQTRLPAALVSGRMDAQVGAYAAGQAPADSVLATPANKLTTNASGQVTAGTVADKTGYRLSSTGVDDVFQYSVEGSLTWLQAIRVKLAALAGKLSGAATTTVTIRDQADTKARITATVDANGNRTAVTVDGT